MEKKFWVLFTFLLLIGNNVFSFSPKREAFIVWNYSKNNIVVEREFVNAGVGIRNFNYMWEHTAFGMTLSITDMIEVVNTNIIGPNQYLAIISYFPLGPQLPEKYNRLYALPFIDKMNAIFRSLNIRFDDGRSIVNLGNLGNIAIRKWGRSYILEVYDSNDSQRGTTGMIGSAEAPMQGGTDFSQDIITFFDAISFPDGRIFLPESIPGYTPKEHQALLTHAIEHQSQFQNGNSQEVFQQLLREAMLYFQGINVFRTRNPPYWYLEYDAQQIQNNVLRVLWN